MLEGYIERKWMPPGTVTEEMKETVADYLYQYLMRDGTSEYAPMIAFTTTLQARIPLGVADKLAQPGYDLPISFVYGDNDWV